MLSWKERTMQLEILHIFKLVSSRINSSKNPRTTKLTLAKLLLQGQPEAAWVRSYHWLWIPWRVHLWAVSRTSWATPTLAYTNTQVCTFVILLTNGASDTCGSMLSGLEPGSSYMKMWQEWDLTGFLCIICRSKLYQAQNCNWSHSQDIHMFVF